MKPSKVTIPGIPQPVELGGRAYHDVSCRNVGNLIRRSQHWLAKKLLLLVIQKRELLAHIRNHFGVAAGSYDEGFQATPTMGVLAGMATPVLSAP